MQKKKRKSDKDAEDEEMKEERDRWGQREGEKKAEIHRGLKKKRASSSASREELLFSVHVVGWLATS